MDIFSIFFNMKVCYVFSLEPPHRGDSNETNNIPLSIKKKTTTTTKNKTKKQTKKKKKNNRKSP